MTIDWDDIFDEADMTPRARLATALSDVDDIEFVVIVFKTKDSEVVTTWSEASYIERLGAIHMAAEALYHTAHSISADA